MNNIESKLTHTNADVIIDSLRRLGGISRIRRVRELSGIPFEIFKEVADSLVRSGKIEFCEEIFECMDLPSLTLFEFCESYFSPDNDTIYLSMKLRGPSNVVRLH